MAELDAARALEFLSRIVDLLSTSGKRQALVEAALDAALVPLGLARGAVCLRGTPGGALQVVASRGLTQARASAKVRQRAAAAAAALGKAALRREGVWAMRDLSRQEAARPLREAMRAGGTKARSAAAVPIAVGARRIGTLVAISTAARDFSACERSFLKLVGALLGWALVGRQALRDTSSTNEELKRLAAALDQRTASLKELDRFKTQSIHLITHEMRKPLTPIFTYADMLLGLEFPPDKQREFIRKIREAADEMNQYVNEMIATAKLEEGGVQMLFEDVDLRKVVEQAADRWRKAARDAGVRLETRVSLPDRTFTTDGTKIGEVLEDLIENGVKYTPQGGLVTVTARTVGEEAEFTVQDTGIGIPPEEVGNLFQKFHIVKKAAVPRPTHRAGLGLYLARVVAEALGGSISVSSQPGKGSTFTVRVPVGADE